LPFRGLLRLYTRYGPSIRSTAQGGLCRGASTGTVTRPGRPPATGPTDHCPGGTCTHEVIAPFGAHRIIQTPCLSCLWHCIGDRSTNPGGGSELDAPRCATSGLIVGGSGDKPILRATSSECGFSKMPHGTLSKTFSTTVRDMRSCGANLKS